MLSRCTQARNHFYVYREASHAGEGGLVVLHCQNGGRHEYCHLLTAHNRLESGEEILHPDDLFSVRTSSEVLEKIEESEESRDTEKEESAHVTEEGQYVIPEIDVQEDEEEEEYEKEEEPEKYDPKNPRKIDGRFDLMELFIKNPGKVYTRENLLDIAWGFDYPGDVRTVDVHVRRLREKIEENPAEPKYIKTKWGVGYYYKKD